MKKWKNQNRSLSVADRGLLVRSAVIVTFKNRVLLRLLMLLLVVGGLTFIGYETGLIQFFLNKQSIQSFLDSLGPLAFLGFISIQAAQVVFAPIPGEVSGLIGGYLYGPLLGIILSTIGLTIGSYAAFSLARILGRPFVEKFVDRETMSRFDYLLHHKGVFLVFLLFLIPGFPKDLFCYILGLGHLTTLEFLIIGGTGRLFGTILLTLGGSYIRHHQYYRFSALLGIALIVVFLSMVYKDKVEHFFKKLQRYHKGKDRK